MYIVVVVCVSITIISLTKMGCFRRCRHCTVKYQLLNIMTPLSLQSGFKSILQCVCVCVSMHVCLCDTHMNTLCLRGLFPSQHWVADSNVP